MLEGNTFSQLSPVKILTEGGIGRASVGAGLHRDASGAVYLAHRVAAIASKPAPTRFRTMPALIQLQNLGQYDFRAFHLFDDDAQAFDFQ